MKKLIWAVVGLSVLLVGEAGAQDDRKLQLAIEAQSLADALNELAQAADIMLIGPAAATRDMRSPGLRGTFTPRAALDRLLESTSLTYEFVDARTVAIHPRPSTPTPTTDASGGEAGKEAALRLTQLSTQSEPVAPAGSTPQSVVGELETIMVTAQRRTERLIDVPLSMSVLGAEDVERRALVSREDYLRSIPSVSLRDDGVGLGEIVIRGAYGDSFRTGPTVGLYFGDVPLSGYAIGGSADIKLIDMARVEVLRGPQGTLYGSNALSGAVRYIPTPPDLQKFSGSVRAGFSNTAENGRWNNAVDGVLNLPIVTDKLALRAVVFRHFDEGYVRNIAGDNPALQAAAAASGASNLAINKSHIGATEYLGGRLSLLWQPLENLGFNLTYVNQRDSQDDRLFELRDAGAYQRADYQLGDVIGGSEDAQRIDLDIVHVTADYGLGFGTLYSSTAWMKQDFARKWDIGSLTSLFGTPLKPIGQASTTEADIFVQEVRFTSAFEGPFQMVTGLYYEDSSQPTQQPTYFGGDPDSNPFAAIKLWQIDLERDVKQKAAYGQLSYEPVERLKLTLGGRYFDYDSRFSTRTFDSVILAPSSSDTRAGESGQTYKAGVEFKPNRDSMIYGSWSQGFRLGRPLATELIRALCDVDQNGLIDGTNISSNLDRVDSDRLDSYELGAKFAFANGRMMLSTAVYQNDWMDIPVVYQPPGCSTTLTINGGTARARGIEGEANMRLLESWKLSLGVGYVDSELTSDTTLGRNGDELNYTPKINGNFGLEYGFRLAQRDAFIRSDYVYFGSYYTQTGGRGVKAEGYSLFNLRGGVSVSESAEVSLHVDNLFNADDFTTVVGPSGFPPGYSVRLRPRTIGVALSYRF